ncbi:hypothetical protein Tco_1458271 [Tanacetum coccineum]
MIDGIQTFKVDDGKMYVKIQEKNSECNDQEKEDMYLKGQPKLGLWYPKDSPFDLVAYTDSDYAGANMDRKSTTGGKAKKSVRLMMGKLFEIELELMLVKVNAVEELGEDSAIPSDPHHTPTIIQPLTQPQKTQKPRKPKRKDTQVPQPSDPIENVIDEAVHKELYDSLVRATTTASNLEAEQDSETIGDTTARTSFENVAKHSNDSLLAREKRKTTQHNEIVSLKKRVKKLKRKNRLRTHRLKRLYKVGLTARVESFDNKESLGEDASKQGRIDAIDTDEEITLENDEVNVVEEVVNTIKLITDVAQVSAADNVVSNVGAATTTTNDDGDITLAQALIEMKSTKPKNKGVVIQELGESTTTISSQLSLQQSQDKGKEIMIETVKPMKKKDQISFDEEIALKLQAEFDEEERLTREKAKKEKRSQYCLE